MFLTTENLAIGYSAQKTVAAGLSLGLEKGQLTSLLGPNGAGKSTLLRTLASLQEPLYGQIFIDGKPISDISKSELTRIVSVVLTDKMTVGGFTVFELASMGRQPYTGFFGKLKSEDICIVNQSLAHVGIWHKRDCYVSELSDGERQKVMIAKALAQQTPMLILDEPTAFLDAAARIEIMQLLHTIANEQDKAIVLSTHEVGLALQVSDYLWLMNSKSFNSGKTDDMIVGGFIDNLFENTSVKFNSSQRRFIASDSPLI